MMSSKSLQATRGSGRGSIAVFYAALLSSNCPFGSYAKDFVEGNFCFAKGRCRDVLPLPLARLSDLSVLPDFKLPAETLELALAVTGAGLNFMFCGGRRRPVPRTLTALHRKTYERLIVQLCAVLESVPTADVAVDAAGAFGAVVGRGSELKFPDLAADKVAVSSTCGHLDPLDCMDPEQAKLLRCPKRLFEGRDATLPKRSAFRAGCRAEYVKLVKKQARAGKIGFSTEPRATAGVFVVEKRGGEAQREVWDGSAVTEAAARPPKPPRLANPCALADLEASEDRPLWISGRDAEVYFDQLSLPAELRPFMGRPAIERCELLEGPDALSSMELAAMLEDGADASSAFLTPVSRVWPMGFGWSSYAAQCLMVDTCTEAGFDRSSLVTEEGAFVPGASGAVSVATDDVLHYLRGTPEEMQELIEPPLAPLDRVWQSRGVIGNDAKSFDVAPSATALGVVFDRGVRLLPRGQRVGDILTATADLLHGAEASPKELASLGGVIQWQNLLNRPLFSCLHEFYAFVRRDRERDVVPVPSRVQSELALNVALLGLWSADLSREWLPRLPATDASGSYGFGVSLARCTPELAQQAARHAADGAHAFRLRVEKGDPVEQPRSGAELRLPLRRRDFKTLLSVPARVKDHSGGLEASGVVLGLRRLARCARWHGHRGCFLVDAQAVLYALQKGRSGAPTLRHPVGQAGALSLACGWRWRYGYLPSESNPADDPSRGVVVRRTAERRPRISRPGSLNFLANEGSDSSLRSWFDVCLSKRRLASLR